MVYVPAFLKTAEAFGTFPVAGVTSGGMPPKSQAYVMVPGPVAATLKETGNGAQPMAGVAVGVPNTGTWPYPKKTVASSTKVKKDSFLDNNINFS